MSFVVSVTVQLFGPAAVTVPVAVQLDDHPPKFTPLSGGAVTVTVVPIGYVATHTEPPKPAAFDPGPQCSTYAVPVAEGAVTSQFPVLLPSL